MIGKLVKAGEHHTGDARRVLDAIEAIWDAIEGTMARRITPADARRELLRLSTEIRKNDEAADAAVDAKFDK